MTHILICDLGGTHARFARYERKGVYIDFKKYRLRDFAEFSDIVTQYQKDSGLSFTEARFATARTPVDGVIDYKRFAGDPIERIDFNQLEQDFQWNHIEILNDLEAGGYGARALKPEQLQTIIPAKATPQNDHKILISVGTGVGHVLVLPHQILWTHGGHLLPVTVTDEHRRLEAFIRKQKDPALSLIMEDFVSARGLRMITEFVTGEQNDGLSNDEFMEDLKHQPEAIRLFFECLGMHAHNLVSVTAFHGGVYLAGGVLDNLISFNLTDWAAFETYLRPPMVPLINKRLGSIQVDYALHNELPLLGLTTI